LGFDPWSVVGPLYNQTDDTLNDSPPCFFRLLSALDGRSGPHEPAKSKPMKSIVIPGLVISLTAVSTGLAGEKCDVPVAEWRPREALQSKLEALGWQIRSIKATDGCYEAVAVDEKGKSFQAYFNPKTLERVASESDENHG
jgi:hypothetical protein